MDSIINFCSSSSVVSSHLLVSPQGRSLKKSLNRKQIFSFLKESPSAHSSAFWSPFHCHRRCLHCRFHLLIPSIPSRRPLFSGFLTPALPVNSSRLILEELNRRLKGGRMHYFLKYHELQNFEKVILAIEEEKENKIPEKEAMVD